MPPRQARQLCGRRETAAPTRACLATLGPKRRGHATRSHPPPSTVTGHTYEAGGSPSGPPFRRVSSSSGRNDPCHGKETRPIVRRGQVVGVHNPERRPVRHHLHGDGEAGALVGCHGAHLLSKPRVFVGGTAGEGGAHRPARLLSSRMRLDDPTRPPHIRSSQCRRPRDGRCVHMPTRPAPPAAGSEARDGGRRRGWRRVSGAERRVGIRPTDWAGGGAGCTCHPPTALPADGGLGGGRVATAATAPSTVANMALATTCGRPAVSMPRRGGRGGAFFLRHRRRRRRRHHRRSEGSGRGILADRETVCSVPLLAPQASHRGAFRRRRDQPPPSATRGRGAAGA